MVAPAGVVIESAPGASPARRVLAQLTRSRGARGTDVLLRASAGFMLLAIPASLLVPEVAALVPFVLFTVWTNGPHSPVLPAAYEPILMLYGKVYPPVLIGALGTAGTVFVESINYHVYARVMDMHALRGLRESRFVARLTRMFRRSAFLTIVFCAVLPLPYWIARVLSVAARYPISRHLIATAVGRFPRLWFFSALGTPLAIHNGALIAITAGSIVLAVGVLIVRRTRAAACEST